MRFYYFFSALPRLSSDYPLHLALRPRISHPWSLFFIFRHNRPTDRFFLPFTCATSEFLSLEASPPLHNRPRILSFLIRVSDSFLKTSYRYFSPVCDSHNVIFLAILYHIVALLHCRYWLVPHCDIYLVITYIYIM